MFVETGGIGFQRQDLRGDEVANASLQPSDFR